MPTTDYHVHWWPPTVLEYLDKASTPAKTLPPLGLIASPPVADLKMRIDAMDEAEIDVSVLSNSAQPDARVHPGLAEINNDGYAAIVSDRFRFYASLPLPLIDESIAELDRALAMDGCEGVIVPTHVFGDALDADEFEPLLAALNERKAIVALHPDAFRVEGLLASWFMDWTIGAPFEDTIVVMRLLSTGRLDQFPDIRWIVPHAGGTLPLLWQRLDKQWASVGPDVMQMAETPSAYADRFVYDTAANSPETLALAVNEGATRFVMGTDFPFVDFKDLGAAVRTIKECPALDEAASKAILEGAAVQ